VARTQRLTVHQAKQVADRQDLREEELAKKSECLDVLKKTGLTCILAQSLGRFQKTLQRGALLVDKLRRETALFARLPDNK